MGYSRFGLFIVCGNDKKLRKTSRSNFLLECSLLRPGDSSFVVSSLLFRINESSSLWNVERKD